MAIKYISYYRNCSDLQISDKVTCFRVAEHGPACQRNPRPSGILLECIEIGEKTRDRGDNVKQIGIQTILGNAALLNFSEIAPEQDQG